MIQAQRCGAECHPEPCKLHSSGQSKPQPGEMPACWFGQLVFCQRSISQDRETLESLQILLKRIWAMISCVKKKKHQPQMTLVTAHICLALVLVKYHWLMTKSSLSGEVDEQKWAACLAGCWWHFSRPTGAHQAGREKASTGCCCKQATICSCGCFSTTNTFQ